MKRITVILMTAVAILAVCACGNNSSKKKASAQSSETEAEYLKADLKAKMDSLVNAMSSLSTPAIMDIQNGKLTLTEKEKKNKPEYLLPLSKADEAVTLNDKYREVVMYRVDMSIAELYGMPVDNYKQVISKLLVDINNPVLTVGTDGSNGTSIAEGIRNLYNEALKTKTLNYFWNAITAGTIEELFIITQNIDKFMPCFDDKSAAEVSYRFILVHEGIKALIPYHPELEQLQSILKPLEVINAISVQQLRDQLMELKGEIETARGQLL